MGDGNEYTLKPLTLGMMAKLEEKFEQPFTKILSEPWAKHLVYLIYLTLSENHPNLTEAKVAELATPAVLKDFITKVLNRIKE
jgi:hypothetical protein